jgi:hypothetical protein
MRFVFVFSIVAVLAAPRCSAQIRGTVEFSPVVGSYVAMAPLPSGCFDVCFPVKENTSIALGGRVAAWVDKRIAVEGSLLYSASSPADVVASSVRALVSVARRPGIWAYVVGGPAFVGLWGYPYAGADRRLDLGGVVGGGVHLRVAPSIALRAELEQYFYSFAEHNQRDLFLSLGLSVASRIGSATTP